MNVRIAQGGWLEPGAGTWRWLLALAMLGLLVLSLMPPSEALPTTGWDKSNHMLGFAVLGALGQWAWPGRGTMVFLSLLAYGGLIEVLQSLTPDRFAELMDIVADGIGLLVGIFLAHWIDRMRSAK